MADVLKNNPEAVADLKKNGTVQLNAVIADSFVDQLNNEVGRQIATNNPGLTMKQIAIKALEAVRDGKSYVYEVGKNGKLATIKHSSMTQKQFAKALKSLNDQFKPNEKN
jgi:phosphopentomutase